VIDRCFIREALNRLRPALVGGAWSGVILAANNEANRETPSRQSLCG